MKVKQFALHLATRSSATDDVRHNFQLRVAAHDSGNDGNGAWSLGQCHLCVCTIAVWHVFHFVAMTGDVDKWWIELHQWFNAIVESGDVAAFQGRYQFETGKWFL